MNSQPQAIQRPASSRLSKSATLDYYKRELLASQYREAVLRRRIGVANDYLSPLGLRIDADPWSGAAVLTVDGLPVAPGV